MQQLGLSGEWEFRFDEEHDWRGLAVPGCWELLDLPKDHPGPAWYRTRFVVPASFAGHRLWLRFDAVSYACAVWVNGREVGSHLGLWDAFQFEVTDAIDAGGQAEVLLRVEKPASLHHGPGSELVPGAYPLRETLAGFLPYVWGQIFGGIWQDVALVATGPVVFDTVYVQARADGAVVVEAELSGAAEVTLSLVDPAGATIYQATEHGDQKAVFAVMVDDPRPWSPREPALYTVRLAIAGSDERAIRCGLRSLRADGSTLLLNDRPLYPRLALSWGWYAESLYSNPGRERVRADFERLRQMGYNGVKLCLWFPPQYYFDLADELGMLLWVELPMWLPRPSSFWRRQTPLEYRRLVDQARNHPSVIIYSLGCELNQEVGADFLEPLYHGVKSAVGDVLVRDNSGSGEAYGGLLNEFADYYDYHFYSDIQFFRGLLDSFAPRWRPPLPWLFGEFCDLDTFRDLRRLDHAAGGERPWWAVDDSLRNPQGARWQFDIVAQEQRLRANGFWERGAELERVSEQQALLHRKWTLELVRAYREVSGYVVTGEVDTPISTAGMWNDLGRVKWNPAAFRAFNQDLVALVGWDKRRAWTAGGDRAAFYDTWSYQAGDQVRAHLIASHYGAERGRASITWSLCFDDEEPVVQGEAITGFELAPGSVREVAVAEFIAPSCPAPRRATLHARVTIGDESTENGWPLWFFPRNAWTGLAPVALVDPGGRLRDLATVAGAVAAGPRRGAPLLATAWTPEVEQFVEGGGAVVLLVDGGTPAPMPTVELPFWRETVRIVEPHPAWGDFPHDGWAGLQFFGCATDLALDLTDLGSDARPILRRLDARTMQVHDYAAELRWGAGRMIVSTLRFGGGHGDQPAGIARNTAAAYLLGCWLRYFRAG